MIQEPRWMEERREKAWEAYRRLAWPTRQEEDWRYADLSRLPLDRATPLVVNGRALDAAQGWSPLLEEVRQESASHGGVLVWGNGRTWSCTLDPDLSARGVLLMDLREALISHSDLVQGVLGGLVSPDGDKFLAWHQACSQGGVLVYVPKGMVVAKPLQTVYWWDREGSALFPHTVVVLEEGAQATYVDEYLSPGFASPGWFHAVVEILVRPGADLHYLNLQRWGHGVFHFLTARSLLDRDARMMGAYFASGGSFHRAQVESTVSGPGALSHMLGGVVGSGNQYFEHRTLQNHTAPHTTSDLLFKTALRGQARSVFAGLIHVHKKAQKSDAYQANRNLLLSQTARVETLPKLEIEADDVRCTHGATIGTLDQDQRFYLMTRGLSEEEAHQVMV